MIKIKDSKGRLKTFEFDPFGRTFHPNKAWAAALVFFAIGLTFSVAFDMFLFLRIKSEVNLPGVPSGSVKNFNSALFEKAQSVINKKTEIVEGNLAESSGFVDPAR